MTSAARHDAPPNLERFRHFDATADFLSFRLVWSRTSPKIRRILIKLNDDSASSKSFRSFPNSIADGGNPIAQALAKHIHRHFGDTTQPIPLDGLDLSVLTPFATLILRTLREEVPAGTVVSYGQLASLANRSGSARAVGGVMSRNPFPLVFPCHRVIKSGGVLGEFGGGKELKKRLLRNEGIQSPADSGKSEKRFFVLRSTRH